jgi:hypothetical protein
VNIQFLEHTYGERGETHERENPETRKKGHRLNPLPTNSTVDAG